MARVREHIEDRGGLETEAVLRAQDLGIAGQGRRMAGYIDEAQDPAQIQCLDGPQRPYARRVDDDALESAAQEGSGYVWCVQIAGKKRRVLDAVAPGVSRARCTSRSSPSTPTTSAARRASGRLKFPSPQ